VRGLAVAEGGLKLQLANADLDRGQSANLSFKVLQDNGKPVTDFEAEHDRRMHVIVVRRDGSGFQHVHPQMAPDGTWTTPLTLDQAGDYRVFADFVVDGEARTLAGDLFVDGRVDHRPLPEPATTADAGGGYEVELAEPQPGMLEFEVTTDGRPVQVDPYLGANGHLVALREGDLAYLHVHPAEHGGAHGIAFETEFPSTGRYALYLQFKDEGKVRTAQFTRDERSS
jgi:hypothetical protein